MSNTIHITVDDLHARIAAACVRAGLSRDAAIHTADSLTEAECAGRASHGLVRVESVCTLAERKKPGTVVVQKHGSCFLGIDGSRHMAYHPGVIGIEKGAEIAAETGICVVGVRNSAHSGMLGFFARRIAREGFWGLIMAHCVPLMAPHGGARSIFGTNPVALGVPRADRDPLIIDFSPAATTFGAILVAEKSGEEIPDGLALDKKGRPTNDPGAVRDGGTLLPAAGAKGSALALMVQLLCGPLIGAATLPERATNYGLLLILIRSDLFRDGGVTEREVEHLLAAVEGCPPMEGFDAVRLPGERATQAINNALQHGLEVDRSLWNRVGELAGAAPEV